MKVLVAVDGSDYSEMCIQALKTLGLPAGSVVNVLTVVQEHKFLGGLSLDMLKGRDEVRERFNRTQEEVAESLVEENAHRLKEAGLDAKPEVARGKPDEVIIGKLHKSGAQLLVIGAKGMTDSDRFPLGSVASRMIKHADCSVLLAKERIRSLRRILIGVDGSKFSNEAIRFLLSLELPSSLQVFLVSALQSHVTALLKSPSMNIETNWGIVAELQKAEEEEAGKLLQTSEKRFAQKGFGTTPLVRKGEAASEILHCANTFNPEIVVVGAKGLGAVEGFLMGSVSRRIARFSRYSVLIVRPAS
ncbi:MAG: universal stress protein [Dehalococcoidia bacterium]